MRQLKRGLYLSALALGCLSQAVSGSRASGDTADTSFSQIAKQMAADQNGQGPHAEALAAAGLKAFKADPCPAVEDSLSFLNSVIGAEVAKKVPRSELIDLMAQISLRYQRDSDQRLRVLTFEAPIYSDHLHDTTTGSRLLAEAKDLLEVTRIQHVTTEASLYNALGSEKIEQAVAQPLKHDELTAQALEYFKQGIDVHSVRPRYFAKSPELTELYVEMANQVVNMTPSAQIKDLDIWPMAWDRIAQTQPDKARYLQMPFIQSGWKIIGSWLEEQRDALPKNDPMRVHLQATLEYLATKMH